MPFVVINCGALPENLIESELFGHRRGSFTGADEHRTGLFEVAHGGTLFLDEIGELPKSMQAKLLRVLETGDIRRVGDNASITVDVRVVCATHRDLEQMVTDGGFREDLMYRINTFEVQLPPLRDRADDIPDLARHLLRRFKPHARTDDELIEADALEIFKSHFWPGNVRELANCIERAVILSDDGPITAEHLPRGLGARRSPGPIVRTFAPQTLHEIELSVIQQTLERHSGNKPKAAKELGISLKTLYNKLNQAAQLEESA
jgi:two-component system NtrC family response regulator